MIEVNKTVKARSNYNYTSELFNRKLDINDFPKLKSIYDKSKNHSDFLTKIKDNLDERDNIKGAFICNVDIFRIIYKLEKRRIGRKDKPLILCDIKFKRKDLFDNNRNHIKNIIVEKLRKGDIVIRWDPNQ